MYSRLGLNSTNSVTSTPHWLIGILLILILRSKIQKKKKNTPVEPLFRF